MSFKEMWEDDIKQFEMAWNSKSKSKKQGASKKKDSSESAKECI